MSDKTGGPAYPTPAHNLNNDGMTLRDWFAGIAMQMVSKDVNSCTKHDVVASWAYARADAMLKAREAK